ncbi:MAG: tetratricopeptide repeat protein [Myxococcota bacterium]|nr:tetratricopeptide repeat protein [Myxococcota bacterium]
MKRIRHVGMVIVCALWAGCTPSPTQSPPAPKTADRSAQTNLKQQLPATERASTSTHRDPPGEACLDCHPTIVENYRKTGMGRSLSSPQTAPMIEDFAPKKARKKHPQLNAVYRAYIDKEGTWWQEESIPGTTYRRAVEVKYIIGSGNHTRSYLGIVNDQLVELPLTWYSQRKLWDMSPGYEGLGHFRFFRTVTPECLFCHNGLTRHRPHSEATYDWPLQVGIGCERCHGDGAEHIEKRLAGQTPTHRRDPWIFNPAHLSPRRGAQVCQQCHLQGTTRVLHQNRSWDEYSPRIPLERYLSVYSLHTADDQIEVASQAERLAKSACRESDGSPLRCERCHDPHHSVKIDQDTACRSCHSTMTNHPQSMEKADVPCADCHMARGPTTDAPHVRFRDHWIQKKPAPLSAAKAAEDTTRFETLLDDYTDPVRANVRRSLGLVLTGLRGDERRHMLPKALTALAAAIRNTPAHSEAWRTLGRGHFAAGNIQASIEAYDQYARLEPNAILYREFHAQALARAGRLTDAERTLRIGIEKQPGNGVLHGLLGALLHQQGRFGDAAKAFEHARIALPDDSTVAFNQGMNHLSMNDPTMGQARFEQALQLDPFNSAAAVQLARLAAGRRNLPKAERILMDGLKRNPDAHLITLELARLYRTTQPARARQLYRSLKTKLAKEEAVQSEVQDYLRQGSKPENPPRGRP